ncbi:hypothetical protein A3755_14735 [Oleiphilus sp. HI0085]|nr:hypothetical protein A3735_14065 [Oleiphilus sp. HI0061]KZY78997.1 hypothetical protein A3741_07680 [Oleiphilus sp. HI0069]KZZ47680.1 hypothetical protein A3755_14735 [Oleiphilus sp. HI0085]
MLLVALISSALVHAKQNSPHRFIGNVTLVTNYQDSGNTWLNGGLGRFGQGDQDSSVSGLFESNIEYRYRPSSAFQLSTHIQAQGTSNDSSVRSLGVIEWSARYRHDIDFNQALSVKLGQFFLPTSMENIDRFWESPYTISYSSLNSWIGEEFHPIGLDMSYRYHFDSGPELSAAATVFGGNDSMGALLAYRGWTYGRQRTVLGDVLALPELSNLQDGQIFAGQRDDGTKPFGRDLDGRPGYALRSSLALDELNIKLTWVDNRGDTTLLHAEYAWKTRFAMAGLAWRISEGWEFLSEASQGSSEMGAGPGIDIDFYSLYGMFSYRLNDYRISYRYDQFGIDDQDQMDQENNEFGRSHTLALMWQEEDSALRLGAEVLFLKSKRYRVLEGPQVYRDSDSISVSMLAQYTF